MTLRSMVGALVASLMMMMGLGAALLADVTTAAAAGSWSAQTVPSTVPLNADLKGVFFLDAMHGWTVGGQDAAATALYTNDGGLHWNLATVNGDNIGKFRVAHFIDVNNGFAVTDSGHIYRSTDGGQSWNVVTGTPTSVAFEDIHFGDSKHGCAVGASSQSAIVCTRDGGATWTKLADGKVADAGNLEGISYASSSVAYAVGDKGILKTTNADSDTITDVSWTQLAAATPAPTGQKVRAYADVHCVDTTHCWIVGEDGAGGSGSGGGTTASTPFIAVTTDGSTFSLQTSCTITGLEAVSLPPGDLANGWVAGGNGAGNSGTGALCTTSDGGSTAWTPQASSPPNEYMDVWMVDSCHGWAVSEAVDGGLPGIQVFTCPPPASPSPTATAAAVKLPKAGTQPGGTPGWVVVAVSLLLTAGGVASLRRACRS